MCSAVHKLSALWKILWSYTMIKTHLLSVPDRSHQSSNYPEISRNNTCTCEKVNLHQVTKITKRQWNIISVPYFPPNFQQALTYARSKVLMGTNEDLNPLGCHNKSTGQQLTFWRSTLPPPSKCSIPLFLNQYALMMETAHSSRTLATTYQQTQHTNSEDLNLIV